MRIAVLLLCVCAGYAHDYLRPCRLLLNPSPYRDLNNLTPDPEQSNPKPEPRPYNKEPAVDVDSEERRPWNAEPYMEALRDFEDAISILREHFTPSAFDDKDSKEFNYIILVGVLNYLTREIASNGWESYRKYNDLVKKYIDDIISDPREAIRILECAAFKPTEKALEEMKELIENPEVQYVCKEEPTSCNAVIWTILQLKSSPELSYSRNVLLAAGNSASIFLKTFAPVFEAVSDQNVYKYLSKAKDDLKSLLEANVNVLDLINSNGEPDCELENTIALPKNIESARFNKYYKYLVL